MSRSIRRHRARVAKARKRRILVQCWGSRHGVKRPWRELSRSVMSEPGWWIHEFMTRPARAREHQTCRLIECGRDPDEFLWGDNRKPHKYYW